MELPRGIFDCGKAPEPSHCRASVDIVPIDWLQQSMTAHRRIGIRIGRDSRSFLTERKSPPLHIPKVRATRSTPADANISEVLCCGRPGLVQLFNRLLSFYAALVPDIRRSPVMEELTIENTLSASCVFNLSVDGDDSGGYVIFSTK